MGEEPVNITAEPYLSEMSAANLRLRMRNCNVMILRQKNGLETVYDDCYWPLQLDHAERELNYRFPKRRAM